MTKDTQVIERPTLTFIPEVAELVRKHYKKANVILEYGSGGSTVMASEMPGKTIYSVESSRVWSKMMRAWFDQEQPPSMPMVQRVNVGKTGKWGKPVDHSGFKKYHLYPTSIWDTEGFKHPDVILIDGRFRVACALTAMLRCTKKTTLLFDDYTERNQYHLLEDFIEPDETVGEMARFTIRKTAFPRDKMTRLIGAFAQSF
jgi:hypothetical protein